MARLVRAATDLYRGIRGKFRVWKEHPRDTMLCHITSCYARHATPRHASQWHATPCTKTNLEVFEYLKKFVCGIRVRLAMALGRRWAGTTVGTGKRWTGR